MEQKKEKFGERLVLTLEGLPKDGGYISASLYASVIHACQGLMKKAALRKIGKEGEKIDFFIAELSHASPMVTGIVPDSNDSETNKQIVAEAEKILQQAGKDQAAEIPAQEFNAVEKLIHPFRSGKISVMEVRRVNGSTESYPPVVVDQEYVQQFIRARKEEMHGITTIAGKVEMLDLHGAYIKLRVVPEIGDSVICRLPADWKETAIKAIGKRAAVTGTARYRPDVRRPRIMQQYRIDDIKNIEVFEEKPDALALKDFYGAFPDMTGGRDALDYLRELRGEED